MITYLVSAIHKATVNSKKTWPMGEDRPHGNVWKKKPQSSTNRETHGMLTVQTL